MRRGCISLGQVECNDCHRVIPYPERYLAIDEEEGMGLRLCIDCALKRGYARYKVERGETMLTFLEEELKGETKEETKEEPKEE